MPELTAAEAIDRLQNAAHQASAAEKAAEKIASSKTRLVLSKDARAVFFATLAMRLKFAPDWSIDTACVNGRDLKYNPDFVCGLSDPALVGLLAHEIMHCCNKHFARRNGRDMADWNTACDLAVNPLLREAGFTLPTGGVFPGEGKFKSLESGKSAEEYYNDIHKQDKADDAGEPSDDEPSEDENESDDPGACGGVEDAPGPAGGTAEPAEVKQLDSEWSANVASAAQAAERRGELPGGIQRMCAAVLEPARDWKAELREFITRPAKANYNWKRPNRRHIYRKIYLPTMHSLEIGHVIAAIDTSGSITESTLRRFCSELVDISRQGVSRLTIVYHDSVVVNVQEWTPEDGELSLIPCGGGGTAHEPVFQWIEENCEESPAVLICLTDLCSSFPGEPTYPTLWASTCKDAPHPFGERLDIPAE
jgi:predicted metal-dependent peptidase